MLRISDRVHFSGALRVDKMSLVTDRRLVI